jgi:hypothetical protein
MTTNTKPSAATGPVADGTGAGAADRSVAAALAGSAAASASVPTADGGLHTPASLAWRWVVGTEALDLYASAVASPDWRDTYLAAGGALHRARLALAAEGLATKVALLPDDDPAHLARLVTTGQIEVTPEAIAAYDATDPALEEAEVPRPPSRGLMRDLGGSAKAEGVKLRLVRAGGDLVGVLHGPDTHQAWLRAGAALCAVRLLAGRHGMTTVPEVASSGRGPVLRSERRRLSDREGWLWVGIGTPYVRLRLSVPPVLPQISD